MTGLRIYPALCCGAGTAEIMGSESMKQKYAAATNIARSFSNSDPLIPDPLIPVENFSLAPGFVPRYLGGITRSLRELPLVFGPRICA